MSEGRHQGSASLTCAQLTARGRGAIAVVAVAGPDAAEVVSRLFRPFNGRPFSECRDRQLVYGVWQPTGEDVVILNESNSAINGLEIHCHGGSAAVDSVLQSLTLHGANEVAAYQLDCSKPKDFWTRGVVEALQRAATERVAGYLLGQLKLLPLAIDEIVGELESNRTDNAVERIDALLSWSEFGLTISCVPSVVLCGQPNVGKSSLINAIVGFERAIVHDTPGTTRDVVTQQTAVDGWPIELKDTAGLRDTADDIEWQGVQSARQQIDSAAVVLAVFDASTPWRDLDQQFLEVLPCNIIVHNKSDQSITDQDRPAGLSTSATQGTGVQDLVQAIATALVPNTPPNGIAFCVNSAQVERLSEVRRCLLDDGSNIHVQNVLELLAQGNHS